MLNSREDRYGGVGRCCRTPPAIYANSSGIIAGQEGLQHNQYSSSGTPSIRSDHFSRSYGQPTWQGNAHLMTDQQSNQYSPNGGEPRYPTQPYPLYPARSSLGLPGNIPHPNSREALCQAAQGSYLPGPTIHPVQQTGMPQDSIMNTIASSRNKNRNTRPCGHCSGAKVRCNVSQPYTKILCERCEKMGLTECPPYVRRYVGTPRVPDRKKNPVPRAEPTDTSDIVFDYEEMSSLTNTAVAQVEGGRNGEVVSTSENTAYPYSHTTLISSVARTQHSVGHGETIPAGHQANIIGFVSGDIATTSGTTDHIFYGSNTNSTNEGISAENQLYAYNCVDLVNGAIQWKS